MEFPSPSTDLADPRLAKILALSLGVRPEQCTERALLIDHLGMEAEIDGPEIADEVCRVYGIRGEGAHAYIENGLTGLGVDHILTIDDLEATIDLLLSHT